MGWPPTRIGATTKHMGLKGCTWFSENAGVSPEWRMRYGIMGLTCSHGKTKTLSWCFLHMFRESNPNRVHKSLWVQYITEWDESRHHGSQTSRMSQRSIGSAWNSTCHSGCVGTVATQKNRGCKDWNIQQNLLGCASQEVVHIPAKGLVPQCTPTPPQDVISVPCVCKGTWTLLVPPPQPPNPTPDLCAQMRQICVRRWGPDLFFVDMGYIPSCIMSECALNFLIKMSIIAWYGEHCSDKYLRIAVRISEISLKSWETSLFEQLVSFDRYCSGKFLIFLWDLINHIYQNWLKRYFTKPKIIGTNNHSP